MKHVPDQAFVLEGSLYRRLERCFAGELGLWGTADSVHLVVIVTFGVEPTGTPKLQELALMAVTNQWLPIEDAFERQLVDHLVLCGRRFFKGLRYNLGSRDPAAMVILTDAGDSPFGLYISSLGNDDPTTDGLAACPPPSGPAPSWRWDPAEGGMPALPQRHAF